MRAFLLLLLLIPQLAAARVYMCVDPVSGKTMFTDTACANNVSGEQVRVEPTNFGKGKRTTRSSAKGYWRSDRDTTKSGREYASERRAIDGAEAVAGVTSPQ